MPSDGFQRTHDLLSGDYADALARLVEALSPYADRGVVRLDVEWLGEGSDGDDCRRAWEAVRDRFDRLPERDDRERAAWGIGVGDESGRDALGRLVGLTNGVVGSHFLFAVELVRGGRTVLSALPHHSGLGVDSESLPSDAVGDANAAVDGIEACLVAAEPHAEWVAEGRRWRVGSGVCAETTDGTRTSCYGVSNLRGARVAEDGTTLELLWGLGGPISEDPVGRALSWAAGKLYRPPERLPCGDRERAESVAAFLASTLRRYDGRDIRGE